MNSLQSETWKDMLAKDSTSVPSQLLRHTIIIRRETIHYSVSRFYNSFLFTILITE